MVRACAACSGSRVPGGGRRVGGGGHSLLGPSYAAGGAAAPGSSRSGRKTAGAKRERHFENLPWEQSVTCRPNLRPGRRVTEVTWRAEGTVLDRLRWLRKEMTAGTEATTR